MKAKFSYHNQIKSNELELKLKLNGLTARDLQAFLVISQNPRGLLPL